MSVEKKALYNEVHSNEKRIAQLEERKKKLKKEREQLVHFSGKLTKKKNQLSQAIKSSIREIENKSRIINPNIKITEKYLDNMRDILYGKAMQEKIRRYASAISKVKTDIRNIDREIDSINKEINNCRTAIDRYNKQIRSLEDEENDSKKGN